MVTEGKGEETGVTDPGSGEVGIGTEGRIEELEVGERGMNLEEMGKMCKSCGGGGEKPTEGPRTGSRMQVTGNVLETKTIG